MQAHAGLNDLVNPIQCIKLHVLEYLTGDHPGVIKNACFGDYPVDELVSEQIEEEVNSLLKVIHRFKESLALTYSELQYGEPSMETESNDHAHKVKEDSKHWEGVESELNNAKE